MLQETAAKRLSAIREYVEFGSGFKIAMRDLEIRGAGNLLGGTVSVLSGIVGGVFNAIMAFIFALYILLGKEKLKSQTARVCVAFLPRKWADSLFFVANMASRTFAKFVSGQCTEACILGTLCWLGMSLLRLPYAPMIGALVGITALIPIVGAWVGLIVGAFMIGMESLTQALIFVIFLLVLQQVEGNLIYPHVVGSSVGLPSIWVLTAVTLGGSLLGILGMLIFIPLCSVLYALFRDFVKRRLRQRGVPEEKWREAPPSRPEAVRRSVPPRDKKPKP